jgi:rsbT co-antagonist protein RsbR
MSSFGYRPATEEEVHKLKLSYGVLDQDLNYISQAGKMVIPKLSDHIEVFYAWLGNRSEWERFFRNPELVKRLKALQISYWEQFFEAQLDRDYVDSRRHIGKVHAEVGLSLPSYFASITKFLDIFAEDMQDVETLKSVSRMVHLDAALTVETYNTMTNEIISEQSTALTEMSTPVTQIWDGILLLPIVGLLDSKRAQDLMQGILTKINATQSKMAILDISGVAVVDTAVANHIIKITKATQLMGCRCIISGISPAIAQTMVELGIDVETISTTASLKDALQEAFQGMNIKIQP